jgi:hypothetical protein
VAPTALEETMEAPTSVDGRRREPERAVLARRRRQLIFAADNVRKLPNTDANVVAHGHIAKPPGEDVHRGQKERCSGRGRPERALAQRAEQRKGNCPRLRGGTAVVFAMFPRKKDRFCLREPARRKTLLLNSKAPGTCGLTHRFYYKI